jgi:aminodeoxyfutalosine deaminase
MGSTSLSPRIAGLPKAELHLHLEGSIRPAVACALAARHGVTLTEEEVRRRYDYSNFTEFIETFKWVTSFLREPGDFALLAADLAEQLLQQHVAYAEVTISIGIMLLRKQDPQANFEALLAAAEPFEKRGLRLNWIFDAVRQFGPDLALDVVEAARGCASPRIVAFGIGGDELQVHTREFSHVYARARNCGLHLLMHAGEVGGPEKVREAVEILGVERIGHGIAAIHDAALMDLLAERRIPLEVCPTSNWRTGALGRQLRNPSATLEQHPLPQLLRHGVPVVLSTDDPAMFHASLIGEYEVAAKTGLSEAELVALHRAGFEHAFLPQEMRQAYLSRLRRS